MSNTPEREKEIERERERREREKETRRKMMHQVLRSILLSLTNYGIYRLSDLNQFC